MFPAPTLSGNQINKIIIKGQMTADKTLHINMETSTGIAWQINVDSGNDNFVKIRNNGNIVHTSQASEWFNSGTQYVFIFEKNDAMMDINASHVEGNSGNYLESLDLDISFLKSISVNGTVEMLTYIFK